MRSPRGNALLTVRLLKQYTYKEFLELGYSYTIRNVISTFSGTERHITVPRVYLELLGDFNTAAFLNQLIFWSDKTRRSDGYFYKTYTEWNEELLLSEYQVRRSAKTLKDRGFIDTK